VGFFFGAFLVVALNLSFLIVVEVLLGYLRGVVGRLALSALLT